MITDHPYKSCFYTTSEAKLNSAYGIHGLCQCPDGINRCHVRNCGKKREEHEVCCEGNDVSCPTHGTEVGKSLVGYWR